MFGAGWREGLIVALSAALAQLVTMLMERKKEMPMGTVLVGSFISALIPGLMAMRMSIPADAMIAGALMPYVPGLAMTKAVADLIRGDMLSGISSGFSALLTAGMIALGTVLAAGAVSLLMGGAPW